MSRTLTILITGCSEGGIGFELAREFHRRGHKVIASARKLESMTRLKNLKGLELIELDVTKDESVKNAKTYVTNSCGGKLNVLINNAGTCYIMPTTDIDIEEARSLYEVNVFGVMRMCKAFIHLLITSGNGKIINEGSIAGIIPVTFSSVYNSSKAALAQYSDTLRIEVAPLGVKVITLISGGVASNIESRVMELPPDSLFQRIKESFIFRQGRSQTGATPIDVYARKVVEVSLRPSPPVHYWIGRLSFRTWCCQTFLPKVTWDYVMVYLFNLGKLRRIVLASHRTMI